MAIAPAVSDSGWGRGARPAINVSWEDAETYVGWLSRITGKSYRLLSEAEYEYAARAGTETKYPWGDDIMVNGRAMANCDGCGSQRDSNGTTPVGSFPANAYGLYDMVGNVREWTDDCWNDSYQGAPADGSPWRSGDCSARIVRGGSWDDHPPSIRSAARLWVSTAGRNFNLGFRVARTLTIPSMKVFYKPMYKGARLDFCYRSGVSCGREAAIAFCNSQNYNSVADKDGFEIDRNMSSTKTIAGDQNNGRDGFTFIKCVDPTN